MNVKENDRVQAVGGIYDGKVGTVKSTYDHIDTAIVDFGDVVDKVSISCLVKINPQKNHEPESDIPEGAKRITKVEFMSALQNIISSEVIFSDKFVDPAYALTEGFSVIWVGHKAASIIFEDKDAVIITVGDLLGALWNACDPATMFNKVNHKRSVSDHLLMPVSAVIVLRNLVTILFGEPEND